MKTDNEILREAVINLTMDNAKLKNELEETKEGSDRYKKWWSEDSEKLRDAEAKIKELQSQLDKSMVMPEGCITVVEEQEK